MGPAEAVQAHMDLGAPLSIAAHFQVFQLGADGFEDAVDDLTLTLKGYSMKPDDFVAPTPGRAIRLPADLAGAGNRLPAPQSQRGGWPGKDGG